MLFKLCPGTYKTYAAYAIKFYYVYWEKCELLHGIHYIFLWDPFSKLCRFQDPEHSRLKLLIDGGPVYDGTWTLLYFFLQSLILFLSISSLV